MTIYTQPVLRYVEDTPQALAASGTRTFPHGLGVVPKTFGIVAQCNSADAGVSAGQRWIPNGSGTTNPFNAFVRADATNIYVTVSSNGYYFNGTACVMAKHDTIAWAMA